MNGGNAYGVSAPHSCTIVFTAAAAGSAFQLKYVGICLLCRAAKRSTLNGPYLNARQLNICVSSFQSLASLWWRDSWSAITFSFPGKYSADITMFLSESTAIFAGLSLTGLLHGYLPSCSSKSLQFDCPFRSEHACQIPNSRSSSGQTKL